MTVAENRERGHYVETAACDRWPLERVDDDRAEWHDLEFVDDVVGDRAGVIATAGEVAEAKSCVSVDSGPRSSLRPVCCRRWSASFPTSRA